MIHLRARAGARAVTKIDCSRGDSAITNFDWSPAAQNSSCMLRLMKMNYGEGIKFLNFQKISMIFCFSNTEDFYLHTDFIFMFLARLEIASVALVCIF